jgi:hypothetical protein
MTDYVSATNSFLYRLPPFCPIFLYRLTLLHPCVHLRFLSSIAMLSYKTALLGLLASLIASVDAHGLVTNVKGANGVSAMGMGVLADTPRNGGLPNPFEVCLRHISLHDLPRLLSIVSRGR